MCFVNEVFLLICKGLWLTIDVLTKTVCGWPIKTFAHRLCLKFSLHTKSENYYCSLLFFINMQFIFYILVFCFHSFI